ncbi:BLUF domain-containing protein [Anabaena sp. UHCC 0187]|uniref:BLUF domain-containing protein n=1 Tax=Anabaena sp. UHCC 0187 TaxID=2590018 RepID=UPI001447AFDA|nr:BLUF domain-containing protein [Anabaena sp. UHCC 0187]MDP5016175.1 BLUF domain-containing protein [Dolichospermum sp.]MTJ13151.1 BLUF domain-containing protein [Anabaena sp. UHCC 0187]
MNLYRLIYSSYAKSDLEYHDLKAIMQKSEKNNQAEGITGLLCYGDSIFLQILEGDRTVISKTYHRIALDTRHHTPELIECIPIESRLFGVWSMKAVNISDLNSQQVRNLILKYSPSTTLQPHTMTAQQCLNLMQALAALYDKAA